MPHKRPRVHLITRFMTCTALTTAAVCASILAPSAAHADPTPTVHNGVIPESPAISSPPNPLKLKQAATVRAALKRTAGFSPASVTFTKVSVSGQMQQFLNWCVPTSSQTTLTGFGVSKSQTVLAHLEGTAPSGTAMSKVSPVLNSYETRNHYILSNDTSSASNLFVRAQVNISPSYSWRAPLIPGMEGNALPLWKSAGMSGYHAITIYGYGSDGSSLQYADPINDTRAYGLHVASSTDIYRGMQDIYDDLIY
jgi:hypothetical protein